MKPTINNQTLPESTPALVLRHTKRWITIVVGASVLGIGLAAIVIPGLPAIVVIPIGLAILATELVWAKHLLKKMKEKVGIVDKDENFGESK